MMIGTERLPWPATMDSGRQRWPLVAVVPVSLGLLLAAILPFESRVIAARRAASGHAYGVSATSHRAAVVDRMYSNALAVEYLQSLQLLDPEVLHCELDAVSSAQDDAQPQLTISSGLNRNPHLILNLTKP